jgi:ABC-type phosphate/phosphonate transport system substrate-binding protein
MKNGRLDMGEFGPAGFVFASQQANAVPLASYAQSNGQLSTYTAGIWVKKGSGKVDAAEINSQTAASAMASHTFVPSQYTQIWKSAPIPNDPVCASASLSAAAQTAIKNALLGLPSSDFTTGSTTLATELGFTPPPSGHEMLAVTSTAYSQLFSLAKALNLTSSNL